MTVCTHGDISVYTFPNLADLALYKLSYNERSAYTGSI